MPQRAKTPPPPQDEIFMTIFYPYPQHANMEVEEDFERVARWLGTIVAPAYFNAFYHKPSARNTVIIEVSKAIGDDKRKLLGQHVWKDILLNPSEGEKRHRSGIYYCVYQNIRDVQKEGWKRIDFEDTWFMPRDGRKHTSLHYDQVEWERIIEEDGVFRTPYPLSSRCEVPMEDPTNRGFCRPLPVDLFPIPVLPEMPREVPGTLEWTKVKALPETAWAKALSKATKGKAGSQKTAQSNDQRGRTVPPRNSGVGPAVLPKQSGVDHKSPGTLPPNLVTNGKGKGKEKETAKPSVDMDELVAHTIAMDLEAGEEDQEYYGAGLENVLASAGIVASPAIPTPDHNPIDHTGVGVHVSGVFTKPIVVEDSLWGDPMEDKKKKNKDEVVLLCDLHGKVCSKGICKVYEKQKREQKKLEEKLKEKLKEEQESKNWRNGTGGPNSGRGGKDGRGIGRGVGRGMRGAPIRGRGGFRNDSGPRSPNNETGANGLTSPKNAWSKPSNNAKGDVAWGADNDTWSPSEMGESAKPNGESNHNPDVKNDSGDDDKPLDPPAAKDWSQSEIGGGSQTDPWTAPGKTENKPKNGKIGWGETSSLNPTVQGVPSKPPVKPARGNAENGKDDGGVEDEPWNPPVAKDWSQSEAGGGSQVGPWTAPGKAENKPKGRKIGWGETGSLNPAGQGVSPKPPVKPRWGNAESAKDDGGDEDKPWNPPVAKDWSQSEVGGGSQTGPWTAPGRAESKPKGRKIGWGETGSPNPASRGAPPKSPPPKPSVKPSWGNTGDVKDWTRSELGLEDSVSQRGGGFRTPPSLEPGKKSWADQVDDEFGYASGDEPAPMVVPAPDLGGDGDGSEEEWVTSGKNKRKGKGKGQAGKAKSATGRSNVTSQGTW